MDVDWVDIVVHQYELYLWADFDIGFMVFKVLLN